MNNGMLHLHARRRIFRNLEPFPSRTAVKRFLDYLMYGVGIVQPVALVPQIYSIYFDGSVAGVSVATWLLLTLFNFLWLIYGIVHREPPIAIGNLLLFFCDLAIVIGVWLH